VVLRNLGEILRRQGKTDELLPFLESSPENLHTAANLLAEEKRYEEAEQYYAAASRVDPGNADILADRAAACLGRGELNEADDLLRQALNIDASPKIYGLLGHTARAKGEYPRCEIVYRKGLEDFPGDPELLYSLGDFYLFMKRYDPARETAAELKRLGHGLYTEKLAVGIQEGAMKKLCCSGCGREWFVPRQLPHAVPLRLEAEPPDDLPAGICPECGTIRCIACAKPGLGEDGRFRCTICGKPLKLSDPGLMWLLSEWAEGERKNI
jgi:tetratricopeptide (TPR) repeat protein